MPEPKPRVARKEKSQESQNEPLCHIHDEVESWEVDEIRENVCHPHSKHPFREFKERMYCLLHYPSKEKNHTAFNSEIKLRLKKLETQNLMPKKLNSQERTEVEQNYSFQYVYFPTPFNFSGTTFHKEVNFTKASFSGYADFSSAVFLNNTDFSSVKFKEAADFGAAIFCSKANFLKTKFTEMSFFISTIFIDWTNFAAAEFSNSVNFLNTCFVSKLDFSSAKMLDGSQINFEYTEFFSDVRFYHTEFSGYVDFLKSKFLQISSIANSDHQIIQRLSEKSIDSEILVKTLEVNKPPYLCFEKAKYKYPEQISFNSVILRPSWFVQSDARMLVFNDVEWKNQNIDTSESELEEEIIHLLENDYDRPLELLIKTFNQLADNAEANRRFEEAKKFRKQSIALEKKQCHIHDETDARKKDDIREKVCRHYPVVNEDGGNYYCLLHNPDQNKSEIFLKEFEKLKENGHTDFRSVVFPITVEYTGKVPDLNFLGATFQRRVVFDEAEIQNLDFTQACFNKISELVIKNSICKGRINLDDAVVEGKIFIIGKTDKNQEINRKFFLKSENSFSMKNARIEKPQWINFRSIRLLPHFFVDVDTSKFIFQDCKWRDKNGERFDLKEEIKISTYKDIAQTSNQLAVNFEENRKYKEASVFRYAAMEANRLGYKSKIGQIFNLLWIYKKISNYGESWRRALMILVGLLVVFAGLYASPLSTFDYGEKKKEFTNDAVERQIYDVAEEGERFRNLKLGESVYYSLAVSALQKPEPKPAYTTTKIFVILQTILAPLQAALLALAIRRKFMR